MKAELFGFGDKNGELLQKLNCRNLRTLPTVLCSTVTHYVEDMGDGCYTWLLRRVLDARTM